MKRIILLFLLLVTVSVQADEPFRHHRYDLLRSLPADTADILFVGNSITDMFPWEEVFPTLPNGGRVLNRGVSGATSDDILANIGAFVSGHPRKLFLMIGTNDLGLGLSPQHVADNVARIIDTVRTVSPSTQIYLQSILPSAVGRRTLTDEQAVNSLLRHIADTSGLIFIDLWDPLLGIIDNPSISFDGLHLTARGYQIWLENVYHELVNCELPNPQIFKSSFTIEPHQPQTANFHPSHLMRSGYFRVLPDCPDGILFMGDEMVKCGEWSELTGRRNLLNRGSGWGYDGTSPSIAVTSLMADAALSQRTSSPSAILLYTGTGELNSNLPLDSVCQRYLCLLNRVSQLAPSVPIYLVSLMPTEHPNPRIAIFNQWLSSLTRQGSDPISLSNSKHAELHYIDIYTSLATDGSANSSYFSGNFLMADGYRIAAQCINEALDRQYGNDFLTLSLLQSRRTPAANRHWVAVSNTFLLSPLPAVVHLLCGRSDTPEDAVIRANGCEMGASLLLTAAVTMGVKEIVRRPRPWVAYPGELECLQHVPSYSFPSGHTSFAFSTATSLTLAYPRWYVAVPAYLWAGAVGYSRMYVGAHYPTDVITGALLGTTCAVTVRLLRLRICQERPGWAPSNAVVVPIAFSF